MDLFIVFENGRWGLIQARLAWPNGHGRLGHFASISGIIGDRAVELTIWYYMENMSLWVMA